MAELWERQRDPKTGKDEPDCAFQAFALYRDMQPRQRSLPAVHAQLKAMSASARGSIADKSPGPGASKEGEPKKRLRSGRIEEWAGTWNWILRARAWDNERDRVRRQAQLDEEVAVGKRHAQLLDATLRALQLPLVALLTKASADPAMLAAMAAGDLLKLTTASARAMPRVMMAERIARGMPTVIDPKAKAAESANSGESLPIEGFEFTWGEVDCVACGHPHSKHDQMHEDPTLVPCTIEGCKCQKFKQE